MATLTYIIFAPALAALLLTFVPRTYLSLFKWVGHIVMSSVLAGTAHLFWQYDPSGSAFQFSHRLTWIEYYGIDYHVGVDGLSALMLVLTALLTFAGWLARAWKSDYRLKEFVIAMLVLETAMLGTFAALDAFLFYVFWEAVLLPMYYLIGAFGGPRRIYATLKFFIYTLAGSICMLLALIFVFVMHKHQFGYASMEFVRFYQVDFSGVQQLVLFVMMFVAFAIKLPVFPFHTWLPDAHVEAPTSGSVVLAGVLLKMGGYGLLRLAIPMFPYAAVQLAPVMGLLAVIGIIYGAYLAWAQTDLKRLIAYSSVSHMGFVLLGLVSINSLAMIGAVFQMVAHGLSTGALFLLAGYLHDREHTREISSFGGLAAVTPRLSSVFLLVTLASIGLPGLCGFVGEFLVLVGAFDAWALGSPKLFVGVSVVGVVLGAAYMLSMYEKVFLGSIKREELRKTEDLSRRECSSLVLLVIGMVVLGLYPSMITDKVAPGLQGLQQYVVEKVSRVDTGLGHSHRQLWQEGVIVP